MWRKAERLLSIEGGILKAPWSTDVKTRLVMSSSSDHPHVVKTNPRSKKQYICDEKCPMFKGYSICSHTIAASSVNGDLNSFIENYKQKKCGPNLMNIAGHGLPNVSGRKGGVPKRKKRASVLVETRSVCPCFRNSDEGTSSVSQVNTPTSASFPPNTYLSTPCFTDRTMGTSRTLAVSTHPSTSFPTSASTGMLNSNVRTSTNQAFNKPRSLSTTTAIGNVHPIVSSVTSNLGFVVGGNVNITNPTHSFINSPTALVRQARNFQSPVLCKVLSSGFSSEHPFYFEIQDQSNQDLSVLP